MCVCLCAESCNGDYQYELPYAGRNVQKQKSLDIWLQATQLEKGEPRPQTWGILFHSLHSPYYAVPLGVYECWGMQGKESWPRNTEWMGWY